MTRGARGPLEESEHEVESRTDETRPADRAGHDILLAMAGRLPDRLLWRVRDWLAGGAEVALRTALPRALLRHRVGVTEVEREMLRTAVLAWGGSGRLVDAVPHADVAPEPTATFAAQGDVPGWDGPDLVLRALVPASADVIEVRRAWRTERASRRSAPMPATRVVLIGATRDLPALTGAVQRALRAQGEVEPRVEAIGPGSPVTAYHREALAASEVLWHAGAPASVSAPGARDGSADPEGSGRPESRRDAITATGELVRHG